MKVCPACNETFGDDLNFCDLDGTRLQRDASTRHDQSKAWSLLGAGLMLGGVVLSAMLIIFFPRQHISPAATISEPAPTTSRTNNAPAPVTQPASESPVVAEAAQPTDLKKKERTLNT